MRPNGGQGHVQQRHHRLQLCKCFPVDFSRKKNTQKSLFLQYTDWLIDWLIDCLIDWLLYFLAFGANRLIDWTVVEWLIGWLIDQGVIDWLIDWLIFFSSRSESDRTTISAPWSRKPCAMHRHSPLTSCYVSRSIFSLVGAWVWISILWIFMGYSFFRLHLGIHDHAEKQQPKARRDEPDALVSLWVSLILVL